MSKWKLIGEYEYACEEGRGIHPDDVALRKKPGAKDKDADRVSPKNGSCKTPEEAKKAFDEVYAD